MKQLMKKILSLLAVLVMTVSLAACSGCAAAGEQSLPGTYKLTGMKDIQSQEAMAEFESLGLSGELVLNEDGTGTLTIMGTPNAIKYDAEAKTVSIGDMSKEFTFDKGTIEFSTDDTFTYVFEKQS
jgi:predicted small lipoprotein YifL